MTAIQEADKFHPGFILMDIRLSGKMDGFKAAEQIYSKYPCKIVFMSGYNLSNLQHKSESVNPVAVLTKPVKLTELISRITAPD